MQNRNDDGECDTLSVESHSRVGGAGETGGGGAGRGRPAALGMNRADCPNDLDEERIERALPDCPPRDRALVVVAMETGLRLSELLRLQIGSVWQGGTCVPILRVSRRDLKGGRGVRARSVRSRAIPLNDRARVALADYLGPREKAAPVGNAEPLFPSRKGNKPLGRSQGWRIIRGVLRGAGLDPHRVWAGHSLRRRFARRIFLATDLETTRLAIGHRWINTTQLYLGMGEDDAAAAIVELGRQKNGPPAPAQLSTV